MTRSTETTWLVAVHPSGKWLAACDKTGHVCMATIDGPTVQVKAPWEAPQMAFNRTDDKSPKGPVVFLSVAVSEQGNSFVVGGGDYVYLFQVDAKLSIPPAPPSGASAPWTPPQNVRWVAISADGNCVTTWCNRYPGGQKEGALIMLEKRDRQLQERWQANLPHNPNSTTWMGAGKYVTACDGYPVGTPSAFYLFDGASGKQIWQCPTSNMNWPMVISKNGAGIVGGGDDGLLYYFDTTPAK